MIRSLIADLRGETDIDIYTAANDAADYLESLLGLEKSLRRLQEVSMNSMANDDLTAEEKGHRLGTCEVCDAGLKMF